MSRVQSYRDNQLAEEWARESAPRSRRRAPIQVNFWVWVGAIILSWAQLFGLVWGGYQLVRACLAGVTLW